MVAFLRVFSAWQIQNMNNRLQDFLSVRAFSGEVSIHYILLLIFCVYILSMPSNVVLEDDGFFLLSAYYNGISHPPGYPLYTLIAHIFGLIPLENYALKIHILSALFSVAACAVFYHILKQINDNTQDIGFYTLVLAVSSVLWSQSIIAEVYTLNLFLLSAVFLLLLKFGNSQNTALARLAALIYGLALSNHWPLAILSSPLFIALLFPYNWQKIKIILKATPFFIIGLLPYIWMIIRSNQNPDISFYGALDSLRMIVFFISREGYAHIDHSPSATIMDKLNYVLFVLREILNQFGYLGAGLIIAGFIAQWKMAKPNLALGLTLAFLCNTLLLIALLDFDFDEQFSNVFRVYPIFAYMICAIWLLFGVKTALMFLLNIFQKKYPVNLLKGLIFIVIFMEVFSFGASNNFRKFDYWTERYVINIIDNIEPDSVLFLNGAFDTGPIGYLLRIKKLREDIDIYHIGGVVFENRLFHPAKDSYKKRQLNIDEFIKNAQRPIYYTADLTHNYGIIDFGLVKKIDKTKQKGFTMRVINKPVIDYYLSVYHASPKDPWSVLHRKVLLYNACRLLTAISYSATAKQTKNINSLIETICDEFHGRLAIIDWLMQNDIMTEDIDALLEAAISLKDHAILKSGYSDLLHYRAKLNLSRGAIDRAMIDLTESINHWNHPDNPAFAEIEKLKHAKK